MSEEFDLSLMWKIFKDLNSQQNILGVDNFEDTLREFIRLLKEEMYNSEATDNNILKHHFEKIINKRAGKELI